MIFFRKILKWILYFLLIPLLYMLISLILSYIKVEREVINDDFENIIYLNTNGIHLDIIFSKEDLDDELIFDLKHTKFDNYLAFGWGDENFYLNTPKWSDLTFINAFKAAFLKSPTLIHVTRYRSVYPSWLEIKVSSQELKKLNKYLLNSFDSSSSGYKVLLNDRGYSYNDEFYKSKGSYSCFNTCNTWVNNAFKESGLKSCLWTPFDFTLIKHYR
tara:strand:- start:7805 stop:8452 length:648 start_codon:yes stop_codon:yes gene_type:complete